MITFNGQDLFSSGPSAIDPGAVVSRDAVADRPGAIGASVVTQGVGPRQLTQRGTLVADDAESLQALINAIQAHVGTGAATLIDQHDKNYFQLLLNIILNKSNNNKSTSNQQDLQCNILVI